MKSYKTLMLGSVATSALLLGAVSSPVLAGNVDVGHKKGSFYLQTKDGKWSALPSGQIQVRYTYQAVDDGSGADDTTSIAARRVRFGIGGRAGNKKLTYKISLNISSDSEADVDGDPGVSIFDSYLNYKFSKALQLRAGVWKQRYTDQHSNSSAKLQFVDRSDSDSRIRADRDMGIGIRGGLFKMLNYELTVVNGNTRKAPTSDNGSHGFVGHIRVAPLGKYGNAYEGDIKNSKKLKVQVSASGRLLNDVDFSTRAINTFISRAGHANVYGWTAGAGLKWRGFGLHGEYGQVKLIDTDTTATGGDKLTGMKTVGWNIEASYFLIPKKWSVAGRYEYRNENTFTNNGGGTAAVKDNVGLADQTSYGLATSYFIRGQAH